MKLAILVVLLPGIRSQESYGAPATSVVNPSFRDSNLLPVVPPSSSSSFSSSSNSFTGSSFGNVIDLSQGSNSFNSGSSFGGSSGSSFGSSLGSSFGSSSGSSFGGSSDSSFGGSGSSSFGSSSGSSSFGGSGSSSFGSSSDSSFGGSGSSSLGSSTSTFDSSNGFSNGFSSGVSNSVGSSDISSSPSNKVSGGVDFSKATRTSDGRLCVIKQDKVETLSKDPILECKHKDVEKCHYTYITFFKPAQEETCEENYEKSCQITFKQEAVQETVRKCYRPLEKVCNGQGPQECRTVYESSCSTKYISEGPGKFVGDTKCQKLPLEICGAGCVTEEGPQECHDKTLTTLVDVPEETCDLNPQKTCRLVTKLVPSLKPKEECTVVPQESCVLKFTQPKRTDKPLRTEWCLDENTGARSGRRYNQ